jgi:hypothetical protein
MSSAQGTNVSMQGSLPTKTGSKCVYTYKPVAIKAVSDNELKLQVNARHCIACKALQVASAGGLVAATAAAAAAAALLLQLLLLFNAFHLLLCVLTLAYAGRYGPLTEELTKKKYLYALMSTMPLRSSSQPYVPQS